MTGIVGLILLGGAGTRLWPLSSKSRPKQFLRLFGRRSLFQRTIERARTAGFSNIVLMTNAALAEAAQADLGELGGTAGDVLLEPARRNSAAAIAAGVAHVQQHYGPDRLIAVLPSDHLIADEAAFARSLDQAAAVASAGFIVTFGIRPTYPATAFGYIERGAPIAGDAFAVARFHEKPAREVAEGYVRGGNFDWNAGMFIFRADVFAAEAEIHMGDIWRAAQQSAQRGVASAGAITLDAATFADIRKTSIDFALMEKSTRVAVVPAAFDWSDVGSWSAVYDALDKDAHANVCIGDVSLADCSGSLVIGEGAAARAIGLRDAVLIATPSGIFTSPRSRAADIKQLLDGR